MEEIKNNEPEAKEEDKQPTPGTEDEKPEMSEEEEQKAIAEARAELQNTIREALAMRRAKMDEANAAIGAGKGKLELETPIHAHDKEFTELIYDFTVLTGIEYTDAMDSDRNNGSNPSNFNLTKRQALALFAKAAAKQSEDLDMTDIMANIGMTDAVAGTEAASLFFEASRKAGRMRISKK